MYKTETQYTKIFELPCLDEHKSFYHKAVVYENSEIIELFSYETKVLSYDKKNGCFTRHWFGNSRTTSRHVKSFLLFYNFPLIRFADF